MRSWGRSRAFSAEGGEEQILAVPVDQRENGARGRTTRANAGGDVVAVRRLRMELTVFFGVVLGEKGKEGEGWPEEEEGKLRGLFIGDRAENSRGSPRESWRWCARLRDAQHGQRRAGEGRDQGR